jgi:hypothetical protein
MMPELFGIQVHKNYLVNVPSSYKNFQQHAEKVKKSKKQVDSHGDSTAMEAETSKS